MWSSYYDGHRHPWNVELLAVHLQHFGELGKAPRNVGSVPWGGAPKLDAARRAASNVVVAILLSVVLHTLLD